MDQATGSSVLAEMSRRTYVTVINTVNTKGEVMSCLF